MVVPREEALSDGAGLMARLEELAERLVSLEWKVHDIVVVPVKELDVPSPQPEGDGGERLEGDGAPHDSSLSGSQ